MHLVPPVAVVTAMCVLIIMMTAPAPAQAAAADGNTTITTTAGSSTVVNTTRSSPVPSSPSGTTTQPPPKERSRHATIIALVLVACGFVAVCSLAAVGASVRKRRLREALGNNDLNDGLLTGDDHGQHGGPAEPGDDDMVVFSRGNYYQPDDVPVVPGDGRSPAYPAAVVRPASTASDQVFAHASGGQDHFPAAKASGHVYSREGKEVVPIAATSAVANEAEADKQRIATMQAEMTLLQQKLQDKDERRRDLEAAVITLSTRLKETDDKKTLIQTDLQIEREWRQNVMREAEEDRRRLEELKVVEAELTETKSSHRMLQIEHQRLATEFHDQEVGMIELASVVTKEKLKLSELEEQVSLQGTPPVGRKAASKAGKASKPAAPKPAKPAKPTKPATLVGNWAN